MKIGGAPTLDDRTAQALYLAACAGLLAFSAAFVALATWAGFSLPWYDPLGHTWQMAIMRPTPVSMDWYGRVGISLALALAAGVTVFLATRRRALPATLLRAASIWALAATLLGLFLYAYTLANRIILPPGS